MKKHFRPTLWWISVWH